MKISKKRKRQVEEFAKMNLKKWDLTSVSIKWSRAYQRAGAAVYRYSRKEKKYFPVELSLSWAWMEVMGEAEWKDVVLHEIAHLLAGHDENHGRVWKQWARKVGAKPQRCFTPTATQKKEIAKLVKPKYTGICPNCKKETYYARKTKRVRSCGECSPGRYDKRFQIKIIQNY